MAGQLQVTTKLYSQNGTAQTANVTHNWTASTSGSDLITQTQVVGSASEEQLNVGPDVGTPYAVEIANLDSTNYVEVGVATGAYKFRIPAGQTLLIPYVASGTTIYMKANTADVSVLVTASDL